MNAALSSVEPVAELPNRAKHASKEVPPVSKLLLAWFGWYCRRHLARHFHALRVSRSGLPPETGALPLVIFSNHASWWDPLVGLVLQAALFPAYTLYAPIDALALRRYAILRKLGFFGVTRGSRVAARQFLSQAQAILRQPRTILAITPQGRFADVRERPARLEAGVGHLAARVPEAGFLPVAVEYVFWEERLPEILVRFGALERPSDEMARLDPGAWTDRLQHALVSTQDALARQAQRRDPAEFRDLLRSRCGVSGPYDAWQWFQATVRGQRFAPQHGSK